MGRNISLSQACSAHPTPHPPSSPEILWASGTLRELGVRSSFCQGHQLCLLPSAETQQVGLKKTRFWSPTGVQVSSQLIMSCTLASHRTSLSLILSYVEREEGIGTQCEDKELRRPRQASSVWPARRLPVPCRELRYLQLSL